MGDLVIPSRTPGPNRLKFGRLGNRSVPKKEHFVCFSKELLLARCPNIFLYLYSCDVFVTYCIVVLSCLCMWYLVVSVLCISMSSNVSYHIPTSILFELISYTVQPQCSLAFRFQRHWRSAWSVQLQLQRHHVAHGHLGEWHGGLRCPVAGGAAVGCNRKSSREHRQWGIDGIGCCWLFPYGFRCLLVACWLLFGCFWWHDAAGVGRCQPNDFELSQPGSSATVLHLLPMRRSPMIRSVRGQ